ncbi:MAG: hypothetical protein FJX46_00215 [Alphaproteobacteria bacterium]|nr:hypothetical protein [Alphaproteobacteria bacterium]
MPIDINWWITVVELPALAGLFWLMVRGRRDIETGRAAAEAATGDALARLRDQLAAFKLEVAQTYASLDVLANTEKRLTEHLVRIEAKLDQVALRGREERL